MNPFTNAQSQRCPSRPETMPGNREAAAASPAQDPSSPTATSPAPDRMEAQRRLSTSSDASSSGHNDSHKLDSTMDYIPTRMTKVSTPKPAANPLQFVKVGPCDLFKSAQETLKKVEEVKKLKREVRDEAEDWQSNLDNWKCSRRKRVEHIIDRVVEVKKFELEEHERNRRKAKTFNEMMEERTSRGRKMSLLVHKDDDSNDLSDLGIGTSSDKSSVSEDYGNDDSNSVEDGDVSVKIHFSDQNGDSEPSGKLKNHNGRRDEVSELEEYTYDRAIQGYVNFTETRVKSRNANQISRSESECVEETSEEMAACSFTQIESAAPVRKPRNDSKVEEDIAEIERLQSDNISSSDLQSPEKKVNVPKVNILKRKELFERSESSELNEHLKVAPRAAGDFLNSKSIRDRVSNLERQKSEEQSEKMKQVKQLSSEISVKDRLSRLERQQSSDSELRSCSNSNLPILGSSGDVVVSPPPSIKDRLSSLEQVASHDRTSKTVAEITPASIKNRLSELEAPKEPLKKVTPVKDPSFRDKLANFRSSELDLNCQEAQKSNSSFVDSSARNSNTTESEFYHKRTFHRSLDSLDVDSSSLLNNERYERVQSLEDLDSCGPNRNYPASASSNENLVLSSHSGDTDREDSGIHTADVSCSVSQADEPADFSDVPCTNMLDGNYENERNNEYAPPTIVSQLAKINLTSETPHKNVPPQPEAVSSGAGSPTHSQVLVDSSNLLSPAFNSDLAPSTKMFSVQHSCLPTIPEVCHDCPPVVLVSDAESMTPACIEPVSSSLMTLPLDVEDLSGCTDSINLEIKENLIPEDVVMAPTNTDENSTLVPNECPFMPYTSPNESNLSCGGEVECLLVFNNSGAQQSCHKSIQEEDKLTNNVSEMVVMKTSGDSDESSAFDKAPIPYSRSGKPGGAQSSASEELLSLTSAETDIDVSSFLDQALMEEDLKMEPVYSRVDPEQKHDGLDPKQLLQFIAKKDICRNNQPQDVAVLPLAFPLTSSMTAEPPKEKPPPPPIELSDEEDPKRNIMASNFNSNNNSTNLTRHGSTKRLIKDIRQKRSDFLGIDGGNEENYLDCELKVAPPPDMTSFLQEERRLEQELYRQMQPTLYPESDHGSNQGESRDSGVELDNHLNSHSLHMDYSPEGHGFEEHSHQNNDLFGNTSSTTEEDEIMKKEREIIEMLEKEEQWRYGTNTILSPSDHHQVGEKLAAKLRELEQEKLRLEWERAEESRKVAAEQAARQEDQRRIRAKEEQLRQQEDALREERQRLKQEQAELERQREYLSANQSWDSSSSAAHRSLQDVSAPHRAGSHNQLNVPNSSTSLNCRLSLPDLQQSDLTVQSMNINHHRPPPPIPLSKPLSIVDQERHGVNGFSRQGQLQLSSDSIPMVESHHHRHNAVGLPSVPVATSPTSSTGSQQMTRQTLHALSAAPRSRIIATDTWVQAKRKPESQRNSNRDHYQHWLIQEAEHRRITEQQQRNAVSRKSLPANLSQNQNPQSKPTSVQPNGQPSWQYQHSQHQHSMHQHQLPLHNHLQHSHIPVPTAAPTVPPPPRQEKPLPDAIIQTLTQRVQNRASMNENNRRHENSPARDSRPPNQTVSNNINNNLSNMNMSHSHTNGNYAANSQEKMLSVSGKKKCSHCNEELGRGAAMIIESLRLFYHMDCFKCCVCHVQLGDGLMGTDVRVRNHKLHCHNCYSSDDGVKFSCV
ncbi:uncharacterized protein LOC113204576 isoform X3 [Frankliniella occidentalis]|uniref:Uncharacterized protein LOC113204576 isoform X3 n=1 Tax=Frankliniella occidentalis TaxID=133901 RepID=A0A9C6TT44_FRAOC|nr:uncharacterized protein LOC113204576 isoform X3 [Frankliniella occidentalis]